MNSRVMMSRIPLVLLVVVLMLSLQNYAQTQQQKPATLRSLLLHELHTTHTEADWFVPIKTAVDGLTAEQASWQPANGGHSAGQLTHHLLFWNRRNLGEPHRKVATKLQRQQRRNLREVRQQTVGRYGQATRRGHDRSGEAGRNRRREKAAAIAPTIGNICTHNAYHVGQIVYVRKLQGSWNPEKGVK